MSTFETPEPISVALEIGVGDLRIAASDRTDTVVEVRPTNQADESDVQAAQQVHVDLTNGTLRITGPKRLFDFSKKSRSVDVTIGLPAGSHVSVDMLAGEIRGAGRLGDCRIKNSIGHVSLERTGPLRLSTVGNIDAESIAGNAEISTGSGKIRLGEIDGTAVVKNSNGDTTIDAVGGDLRVRAANGDITIGRAGAGVDAKSSNGTIRVGEVARGSVVLGTATGDLDIGIADGTAAWLDVNTGFGHVRNQLDNATQPDGTAQTVEVRGRTSYGDITIHRS
jgi:DUF4097 and DUF4098 domain-containing protein YvlB